MLGSALFRADEAFVLEHCPPGRLVDLGCGTGRLLIPLARRGWWVLGVDLSPEMLAVARQRASEAGVEVSLLRANLVDLGGIAGASFDHAACLFSTLGMVAGEKARRRVVAEAFRVTSRVGGSSCTSTTAGSTWGIARAGAGCGATCGDAGAATRRRAIASCRRIKASPD